MQVGGLTLQSLVTQFAACKEAGARRRGVLGISKVTWLKARIKAQIRHP